MRSRLAAALVPLAIVAAVATGCAPKAVAVYDELEVPEGFSQRKSGLIVAALDESGRLTSDAVWPDSDRDDAFVRFTSDGPEPVQITRRMRLEGDRLSIAFVTDSTSEMSGINVLTRLSTGEIVIDFNDGNGIRSDFAQEALFMPPVLNAGDSQKREFSVSSEGERIGEGDGRGESTVTGVGRQRVFLPAGEYDVFVVASELAFKIGPARIRLTQRAWISPEPNGPGLVAEEGRETVKVLGITVHDLSRISMLRAERTDR